MQSRKKYSTKKGGKSRKTRKNVQKGSGLFKFGKKAPKASKVNISSPIGSSYRRVSVSYESNKNLPSVVFTNKGIRPKTSSVDYEAMFKSIGNVTKPNTNELAQLMRKRRNANGSNPSVTKAQIENEKKNQLMENIIETLHITHSDEGKAKIKIIESLQEKLDVDDTSKITQEITKLRPIFQDVFAEYFDKNKINNLSTQDNIIEKIKQKYKDVNPDYIAKIVNKYLASDFLDNHKELVAKLHKKYNIQSDIPILTQKEIYILENFDSTRTGSVGARNLNVIYAQKTEDELSEEFKAKYPNLPPETLNRLVKTYKINVAQKASTATSIATLTPGQQIKEHRSKLDSLMFSIKNKKDIQTELINKLKDVSNLPNSTMFTIVGGKKLSKKQKMELLTKQIDTLTQEIKDNTELQQQISQTIDQLSLNLKVE